MAEPNLSISDLMQPSSHVSEVTQVTPDPRDSSETEEEITEQSCCRVSRRPVMMIAFRKCNGETEVLPYATLNRIRSEDIDTGFTLQFSATQVRVEGQGLTQIFHYLCEHRVLNLRSVTRAEVFECLDTGMIVTIEVLYQEQLAAVQS